MHWKSLAVAVFAVALLPIYAVAQGEGDSRPVILAFGDSVTAGYGVPRDLGYPEQLQNKLDAGGYKCRVVNMGVTGDTTRGGRSRMTRALLTLPTIVILELGGNDR
jgi:acyl-CoA thioesterase-1